MFNDVMYVPAMRKNLVYVLALTSKGYDVHFVPEKVTVGKHRKTLFQGKYFK
ncbi:hypothetical protein, partial [Klebsiella pneumoniae]|uniref:hypothetical protein n=1 Tax=Klebsiella pneumoniae TaxID=573 RepID=UPI0035326825